MRLTLIVILLFAVFSSYGQKERKTRAEARKERKANKQLTRFTFVAQAEYVVSQVDGDFLIGFDKKGYSFGGGMRYRFTPYTHLGIDLNYATLGSKRGDQFLAKLQEGVQAELDLQMINVEFLFEVYPQKERMYLGLGLRYGSLVNYDYTLHFRGLTTSTGTLDDALGNSNFYYIFKLGYDLSKKLSVYAKGFWSGSSLLEQEFENLRKISPYGYGIGLAYKIKA